MSPVATLGLIAIPSIANSQITLGSQNAYSSVVNTAPAGRVDFYTQVLSSDLYINNIVVTGGNFAASGLTLSSNGAQLSKFDSNFSYAGTHTFALGSPLPAGFSFNATGPYTGLVGFTGNGTIGTYTGTLQLYGGSSATSNTLLKSANFSVEIVNSFGLSVEYVSNTVVTTPGNPGVLQHRIVNSGGRDVRRVGLGYSYSTFPTWFSTNMNLQSYPQTFTAGMNTTATFLTATATSTGSPWTGRSTMVYGGYGFDDYNVIASAGEFTVTPTAVPEPATMTVLALGGALLARRRRKAN